MITICEVLVCIVILFILKVSWLDLGQHPQLAASIVDLPIDCFQLILSHLNQKDIINLMLVNRHFSNISKLKLFSNIYVTSILPLKVTPNSRHYLSIPDISLEWTIVLPMQFWKMLNMYTFNPNLLRKLYIDSNSYSDTFIQTIVLKRVSPLTKVSLRGSSLINLQVTSLYITEDQFCFQTEKLPNLRELTVVTTSLPTKQNLNLVPFDCCSIESLKLVGNPLKVQTKLTNLGHLKKLTVAFELCPIDTVITPMMYDADELTEFTLIFGSSYHHKGRPNYTREIDIEFLNSLNFPKLKKLSIFSLDTTNSYYKVTLPNFNELLARVPPLEVLHLSLGCEFNLDIFTNMTKHYQTLKRFVWIGNLTNDMYPRYEEIKDIKFDVIRGILLRSPIEFGRTHLLEFEEGYTFRNIFKSSMTTLGIARGKNYAALESYNYCKGEVELDQSFIDNLSEVCHSKLLRKFQNLQYLIVNGVHFKVLSTFDSNRDMINVYN